MRIVVRVSPVLRCVVVGVREMHVGNEQDGEGEEEEDVEEQEDEQEQEEDEEEEDVDEEEEDVDEEEEDVDEEEAEYAFIASGLLAIVVVVSLPCTQCSMVYPSRTPSKAG